MKIRSNFGMMQLTRQILACSFLIATLLLLESCDGDDPEKVNEEEVITTLTLTLTPQGGGSTVTLKFFDEDGDGTKAPVVTVSGSLAASKTYLAAVVLLNETETPAEDITIEVAEEANDHLFCYTVTGANITVNYKDKDANNKPLGIATEWVTGAASSGKVQIALRHQPGEKSGQCPGAGDTDIEVEFNLTIQ